MLSSQEARRAKFAAEQARKKKQQEFDDIPSTEGVPALLQKAKGGELKKGGKTMKTMKMAKGGSTASKRADGIAVKGKTKGMMPKMAKGGKTKAC